MKRETTDIAGRRSADRPRGQRLTQSKKSAAGARKTTRRGAKASGETTARGGRAGGAAKSTTDLNEIRRWAEARGGKPVSVKGTARGGAAGVLRIDFPGYSGEGKLKPISWDEWYGKFRESNLKFLYQDRAASGGQSRFFKLVSRGTARKKPGAPRARSTSRKR